ncbi:MAG: HPr family phosphocarrier protein [Lachnospiraceae bacterium]|nr:HPr family phosphocarrier protein [Lachnospiraceae bacterium]
MKEFKYTITDEVGIHARPAGLLVQEAKKFASTITFIKGEKSSKATSLMKLMGMGIVKGDEVTIQVEGDDEDAAAEAIKAFMEANF